jgi:hypothetical protein
MAEPVEGHVFGLAVRNEVQNLGIFYIPNKI